MSHGFTQAFLIIPLQEFFYGSSEEIRSICLCLDILEKLETDLIVKAGFTGNT